MFNNGTIYDIINTLTRKDSSGDVFSPEEMTNMLVLTQHEKDNADFKQFEEHQIITDALRSLDSSSTITLTAGVGSLPIDYWHIKSGGVIVNSYSADLVTDKEWRERFYSHALLPKTWCPMARIVGTNIQVYPTHTSCLFEYLKKPTDPFFDYYYNADDNIVYLVPGTSHVLTAGETYIDKDDGTVRSSGYIITSGENKSVELHFYENDRVDVLYRILQKLGVTLQHEIAVQYGIQGETKEQTK
jgi:hypothetical protein